MNKPALKRSTIFLMMFALWGATRAVQAQTAAAVTVTTNSLGTQIPSNFVGFSLEWQYAQDYFGTTAAPNNSFFQLMKNLGGGTVRIGGNSTDEWCWDSGPSQCQHQMTAGMINSIFNASAQTGFGVIAGVNLTDGSTTNAVDTVKAFVNDGLNAYPGSTLIGSEIGNEPDLFDTSTNTSDSEYPTTYSIGNNESDYKNFIAALNGNSTTKGFPWVGPAFAGGWSSQIGSWIGVLQGDGVGSSLPNPALITLHNYPLSNCGSSAGTGTISGLLSASAMNSHTTTYGGYESQVAAKGYKLRIAETNSSACGGTPGVSDVQASALWAMDDMFRYAQVGIVGVNFHGGGTSTSNGEDYSAVFTTGSNGAGTSSQGATVAPLYYAMLMFSNAQGKYLLPSTVSTSDNITAYAVAASASSDPQVFVINKDTSASGLVTIQPSQSMTSATLLVQKGTSLSDSSPTYGGVKPSASTGVLPSLSTTTLTPNANGTFQFTLANASMAMITLHRNPPTATPTPVTASTWRVNAGGPAYTDSLGHVWAADENYSGGTAAVTTSTITGALPGAGDGALYQSQRYGNPFSYVFNVPAGSYQVSLKFVETYFTAAGSRVFNVSINGTTVLTNFDIYATAGAQNKAIDEVFNNIASSGGAITITFGPASVNNAEIQAIQIIPQPATPTFTSTLTKTNTPTVTFTATRTDTPVPPTSTFTSTATNSFTATKTNSPTSTSTNSMTPSATASWTPTNSSTPTGTPSATPTRTFTSVPPTSTSTGTSSSTFTGTPTYSSTPTATNSLSPTASSTATSSFTPVNTRTVTPTDTATATATSTLSWTSTASATSTSTPTVVPPTATPSFTPTFTNSPSNTATHTSTSTFTPTSSWTFTSTATRTNTSVPPTPTATNSFTDTLSPTPSATSTATPTATRTYTWTATFTPTVTRTSTSTSTPTPASGSNCSGVATWNENFVHYAIGAKVTYNGELYKCIQAHSSESTWEPNVTPALWQDVGPCGVLKTASVFPNPSTSSNTVQVAVPLTTTSDVTLQVFTTNFRKIIEKTYPQSALGTDLVLELKGDRGENLANGLYYIFAQAQGKHWTIKLLVLR